MSWSVTLFGTPEGVKKALDEEGEKMSGQSKEEFLEAKPHLQGLLSQCVGQNSNVQLTANGHATFENGTKTYGAVQVKLDTLYARFCE